MGAFFTNYQVRSNSQTAVAAIVANLTQTCAYVSPPKNGWVTVYDEISDSQSESELCRIASHLSTHLSTSVFVFLVHDSDVLLYWLYDRGILQDAYNSFPAYFERVPARLAKRLRGQPQVLLPYCQLRTDLQAIASLLSRPPAFEEDRLAELAVFLGMDELRVCSGFNYFDREGLEADVDAKRFQLVMKVGAYPIAL